MTTPAGLPARADLFAVVRNTPSDDKVLEEVGDAEAALAGGAKTLQATYEYPFQIRAMIGAGKSFVPPPEAVTSAKVEALEWQSGRTAVGTLVAVRAVTVASEVPGLVRRIGHYRSGGA